MYYQKRPFFHVLAVLSSLLGWPVLVFRFLLSSPTYLPRLYCPDCPSIVVLSRHSCPVPVVLYQLSCPCRHVWLSCWPISDTLSWLSHPVYRPGCLILAVLGYPYMTVVQKFTSRMDNFLYYPGDLKVRVGSWLTKNTIFPPFCEEFFYIIFFTELYCQFTLCEAKQNIYAKLSKTVHKS